MTRLRILSGQHAGASINWDHVEQKHLTLGCTEDRDVYIGDWTGPSLALCRLPDGQWEVRWALDESAPADDRPGEGLPAAAQRDGRQWRLVLQAWSPVRFGTVIWCLGPADRAWPDDADLLARHFAPPAAPAPQPEPTDAVDPAHAGKPDEPPGGSGRPAPGNAPPGSAAPVQPPVATGRQPRSRIMVVGLAVLVSLAGTASLGASSMWSERTPLAWALGDSGLLSASTAVPQAQGAPTVRQVPVRAASPAATAAQRVRRALDAAQVSALEVVTEEGQVVVRGVLPSRAAVVGTDAVLEPLAEGMLLVRRYMAADEVLDMVRAGLRRPGVEVQRSGPRSFTVSSSLRDQQQVSAVLERLQTDLKPIGATLTLAALAEPAAASALVMRTTGSLHSASGELMARQPGGVKYILAGRPDPADLAQP